MGMSQQIGITFKWENEVYQGVIEKEYENSKQIKSILFRFIEEVGYGF